MNYGDDRQVVAGVLRPTRELFRLFQKQADEASVWRLGRELDGLERELLAAYQRRDVVEAQAIRRELGSLKATLVERIEEENQPRARQKRGRPLWMFRCVLDSSG